MSRSYCLDTSVIVPLLVPEPAQDLAASLLRHIIGERSLVYLPSFAWAEVGSVLRKKVRSRMLSAGRAKEVWGLFRALPMMRYVPVQEVDQIAARAWDIATTFNLETLYDATFLAVAEYVAQQTGQTCEFWTGDDALLRKLGGSLGYVRPLSGVS